MLRRGGGEGGRGKAVVGSDFVGTLHVYNDTRGMLRWFAQRHLGKVTHQDLDEHTQSSDIKRGEVCGT